jgi:uncharacterized DUF497 family protein
MYFEWNEEKNEWLKKQRGISFEDVQTIIQDGGLLDVHEHPNKEKYPRQYRLIVQIEEYVYIVPAVPKDKDVWFLKTIIPSRKETKVHIARPNKKV